MLADRVIFVCIIVFAGLYLFATSQIPSHISAKAGCAQRAAPQSFTSS